MPSDRPIFVLGCPRSGTTLLGLMIHAHPRLAIPPENRFVIHSWRRRKRWGDLSTVEQRTDLAENMMRKGSQFREMGVSRDVVRARILEKQLTIGTALAIPLEEFAKVHGKARWGDKRPAYYAEVDMLLRLYPDAQFIHIVRDGRDNVASLKRMPWWPETSTVSMATWSMAEWCMRRNQARLPGDVYHTMRYESLVSDPRGELTAMCAFLGEDFDEAMLEPHKVREVVPERKVWHQALSSIINDSAVESWRTGLEPEELGLMETVLGRALKRHDYRLSHAGTRPAPKEVARYLLAARRQRTENRERWKAEAAEARTAAWPVAAQLTSRQRELAGIARPGMSEDQAG